MKRLNTKFDKYLYAGVTAFLVVTAALVVKALLDNLGSLGGVVAAVNSALTPVSIGLIIAFLLSPLVNSMDEFVFIPLMRRIIKKGQKGGRHRPGFFCDHCVDSGPLYYLRPHYAGGARGDQQHFQPGGKSPLLLQKYSGLGR